MLKGLFIEQREDSFSVPRVGPSGGCNFPKGFSFGIGGVFHVAIPE